MGQLQICQHLLHMDSRQGVERFQLDEHDSSNNKGRSRSLIEASPAKPKGNRLLPLDRKTALSKNAREGRRIYGVKEPGPDFFVDFNGVVDHTRGDVICVHFHGASRFGL